MHIEEFQKDTLNTLCRGGRFFGNDPHYEKGPFKFHSYVDDNTIMVINLKTGNKKVLDLRAVLRGFDCQEYVWG